MADMLYVVATPIGNLDDITLRALEVLKAVDVIAAEDTRHSGNLLKHFEIRKPLVSYHEHNEAMRAAELVERLAAGENVALITDAGMPGLSDPGARLIRKCIERGLPYTIVPGVSAILTALVGSEGGWTSEEIDQARDAGWKIVTLGGRILRAETAAIAVSALLQHRFGDLS